MTSGSTCSRITNIRECAAAAKALGLLDTTAEDDNLRNDGSHPPYCYIGSWTSGTFNPNTLKFNSWGSNTGECTKHRCVCKVGRYFRYENRFLLLHINYFITIVITISFS